MAHRIGDAHHELGIELRADVQPEDLVIGGLAVRTAINREDSGWYIGGAPQAGVTLERWARLDDTVVRVSQHRSDAHTMGRSHDLAAQVSRRRVWIPGVEQRRVARIAGLVTQVRGICVAEFGLEEKGEEIDDASFKRMRETVDDFRYGKDGLREAAIVMPITQPRIDREDVSQYAQLEVDHKHEAHGTVPTADHYTAAGQYRVDESFDLLNAHLAVASTALRVIHQGDRIRPSQPQHDV
jgi:hypothetical protein